MNLTPREKRQQRTRQAILDAAREIISERGEYGLSLREIARRIDYSPAGLYEYFGSKEEIVQAVMAEGDQRFAAYLSSVSPDLHPREYMIELGMAYIRFATDNPQHFMLILNRLQICVPDPKSSQPEKSDTFIMLVEGLERAQAAGVVSEEQDIENLSFYTWSLVHGMATLRLTQLQSYDYDWDSICRELLVQSFAA